MAKKTTLFAVFIILFWWNGIGFAQNDTYNHIHDSSERPVFGSRVLDDDTPVIILLFLNAHFNANNRIIFKETEKEWI